MTAHELKQITQERDLSKAALAQLMRCTERQVYRYLNNETVLEGPRLALLELELMRLGERK